jgi:predicted nuclease of predicted toxin-antitoxin system
MLKLLADENVARQKVERLRELSYDIVSIAELGLAGKRLPDITVLRLATAQERIVLTHNGSDFKKLHRTETSHAGILILPDDVRHSLLAEATAQALEESGPWEGRVHRLPRP